MQQTSGAGCAGAKRLPSLGHDRSAHAARAALERGADFVVGLLVPINGSAGIWGPSSIACAQLAQAEINAAGGLLERQVRLRVIDSSDEALEVGSVTADLMHSGAIDAIVGMHTSQVRQRVLRDVARQIPYVYTPLYEGGERTPGVFALGETPGPAAAAGDRVPDGPLPGAPLDVHRQRLRLAARLAPAGRALRRRPRRRAARRPLPAVRHRGLLRAARRDPAPEAARDPAVAGRPGRGPLQPRLRPLRPVARRLPALVRDRGERPARDRRRQHRGPVRLVGLLRLARQRRQHGVQGALLQPLRPARADAERARPVDLRRRPLHGRAGQARRRRRRAAARPAAVAARLQVGARHPLSRQRALLAPGLPRRGRRPLLPARPWRCSDRQRDAAVEPVGRNWQTDCYSFRGK